MVHRRADAAGIACFQICGMLAAQHIPAADLSTVQLLDLLLGPAIAFAVHGEAPTGWALAGGALLLAVLVAVARGLLGAGGGGGGGSGGGSAQPRDEKAAREAEEELRGLEPAEDG